MAGGLVLGGSPFEALAARAARGAPVRGVASGSGGYGPLANVADSGGSDWVLNLPEGFNFKVFGVEGDMMSDGRPTPKAHDGMGSFEMANGNIRLIRNHEDRNDSATSTLKGDPAMAYDALAGGGTTSLEVAQNADGSVDLVRDFVSLSGTWVNCAGGPTPWGTWASCEETTDGTSEYVPDEDGEELRGSGGWEQPHGYVFEVAATAEGEVAPEPRRAMGRFAHEAIAVDPASGWVYETEDTDDAGFYLFVPDVSGDLSAGELYMLAVTDQPEYDTRSGQTVGTELPVSWVRIDDPDPAAADTNESAVFEQGLAQGGATFARLEGCWYGNDAIYFNSTSGGEAGFGQVWEYRPSGEELEGSLRLVFESPSIDVLDAPDNLNVTPRGGVLLCEDGDSASLFLRGITDEGEIFDFAQNSFNEREWCGACWSPDGRTLFVNVQGDTRAADTTPPSSENLGVTMAIWGPWESGAL